MTVTNETSTVTHVGNGATTVWPYNFIILKATDAEVRLFDTVTEVSTVIPAGEYTISGVGNPAGGDVTYAPGGIPLPATKRITISRIVSFTQETDLTNQTPYYPEVLEEQLDYIVMQTQQIKADLARAVLVQPGSPLDPNDLLNDVKMSAAAAAQSVVDAAAQVSLADIRVDWAEEWATNPHNVPVSTAAGGDGATTFSALHWAEEARLSADQAATFDPDAYYNKTAIDARSGAVADYRTGTADKYLEADVVWAAAQTVDLGNITGTVTLNFSNFLGSAKATQTGNVTLGATSNVKVGQTVVFEFTQDATGGRSLTHNTAYWVTANAEALSIDTTANALNVLVGTVLSSGKVLLSVAGKKVS